MESYFKDRTFATDLDFWEYLKSLKDGAFAGDDGSYVGELDLVPGGLRLREFWYFKNEKECGKYFYRRRRELARFSIDLKNGTPYCIEFNSKAMSAHESKVEGVWSKSQVLDFFNHEHRDYTPEEMQKACKEFVTLMIIESKKVP